MVVRPQRRRQRTYTIVMRESVENVVTGNGVAQLWTQSVRPRQWSRGCQGPSRMRSEDGRVSYLGPGRKVHHPGADPKLDRADDSVWRSMTSCSASAS